MGYVEKLSEAMLQNEERNESLKGMMDFLELEFKDFKSIVASARACYTECLEDLQKREEGLKDELRGREKDLDRKNEKISSFEKWLEKREIELNSKESVFQRREDECTEKMKSLEQKEADLGFRENVLLVREQALGLKENALELKGKALEMRENEIVSREKNYQRKIIVLEGKEDKFLAVEKDLERKKTELYTREQKVQSKENSLDSKDKKLKALGKELDSVKKDLEKKKIGLDSREEKVSSEQEAMEKSHEEIALKWKNLKEFETRIEVVKGKVVNLCSELVKIPPPCMESSSSFNAPQSTNVNCDRKNLGESALELKGNDVTAQERSELLKKCTSTESETPTTQLIGCRIKVWWPKDKQFYEGVVESFDTEKKKHLVVYDDGDVEALQLDKERWELIAEGRSR
ncbi:OLC1v1016701C1 [Oldenlandia corymbosa var. corymbosa]|uniref:OLC1v1016701C1 n=1 Tax=Oldenlandia corymbosa var. corymbosa TaxID=529605 RepID=A0AAV1E7Q5_OLDCO|nr:OLC1v1016701C1 [Oldenlandia corymbosa var. corymbosa]